MPIRPKGPWLWKGRGYFFVLDGNRINLRTKDEDRAWHEYHRIMAERHLPAEKRPQQPVSVNEILTRFGDWAEKHRDKQTADFYDKFLREFLQTNPSIVALDAMELRPFHVQDWIDSHKNWNPTTQNRAASAVKRAYSWAMRSGYIPANPIQLLEKAKSRRRHRILTLDEWKAVLKSCDGHEPLRDILKVQRETGARPQELRWAEVRHFDRAGGCLRFRDEESKGDIARVIVLTKEAQEIVKGCIGDRTAGHVFLTANGEPWTRHSLHTALRHLQKRCGLKMDAYTARHTYATDAIENGVEGITVGILMGHVDPSMVAKTYSHLDQKQSYLREAAEKAVKPRTVQSKTDEPEAAKKRPARKKAKTPKRAKR